MANNNDNIDEVPAFLHPSLIAKANFFRRIFTRYSSPSEVTFTTDNHTELVLVTSALLQPQFLQQNPSGMVLEPFRKGRVVTFCDNFDDEKQDNVGGSRADSSRTLSAREAVVGEGEEDEVVQLVLMPLMDLLEETDREMGLEGSRYIFTDDEDENGDGNDLKYRLYNRGY
ncbi:uncharacterized protein LOC107496646 [Arachis duranensis]|uniref:Uncharacterized protein LOC107496646 n=1 Tax=Arachis duranensis TaxID=130453 RepID=A0A6P4DT99_ARADU|nr:uncharacterized protein LOC107496646 [Arachis duranensis]